MEEPLALEWGLARLERENGRAALQPPARPWAARAAPIAAGLAATGGGALVEVRRPAGASLRAPGASSA